MLSAKLVRVVEEHEDQIATGVLAQIRGDPEMSHFRTLPEAELREWGREILHNLGHWLGGGHEQEIARRYDELGRLRFLEDVPLRESIRGLCILKQKMLDFVEDHQINRTVVEVYAEEEMGRRIGRFFDLLICHLVGGYERALRHAAHA